MKPNPKTKFLPLSQIGRYVDEKNYFCEAIVFDPAEHNCFHGCPPYIKIARKKYSRSVANEVFFKIPQIVAHYAKQHAGFTMQGFKSHAAYGKRQLANEIKHLLEIK